MLNAESVLVKDFDNWVNESKECNGVPDVDMIVEQHGLFRKQFVSAFNGATINRIDFKVLSQI